jgi:hydroxyquinol 1,2-dioxygenase
MSVSRSSEAMAKTTGHAVRISGVVYDRQCKPLSGATIQLWQTNADGEYGPGHGTDQMRCCYLQGAVQTESGGRYQVDTIMPGHYKGAPDPPPAHIHFWVSHPSTPSLSTELDAAGDPYLPEDASPLVTLREEAGVLMGRFDIVLTGR